MHCSAPGRSLRRVQLRVASACLMARQVWERPEFEDEGTPHPSAAIPNLLDLVHLNDAEVLQSVAAKYEVRREPASPCAC